MMFVLSCIHVNHLCILYLYYFLVVVHRGPHGRLAFFLLNVLPSENKDYYYYYYYYYYSICADAQAGLHLCCSQAPKDRYIYIKDTLEHFKLFY